MNATFTYSNVKACNIKETYVIKLFNEDDTYSWYHVDHVTKYKDGSTALHVSKLYDKTTGGIHLDFIVPNHLEFTRRVPVKK